MTEREFKQRTKRLALETIRLAESLPRGMTGQVIGKQLLRCATSVGANYRAACRAKSTADMLNKLVIAEEEADETLYWLELLSESGIVTEGAVSELQTGFNEVVAMLVASIRTLREKTLNPPPNPKPKI